MGLGSTEACSSVWDLSIKPKIAVRSQYGYEG